MANRCPFCGSDVRVADDLFDFVPDQPRRLSWGECDSCNAVGPLEETDEEALAAFCRPEHATKKARREALEEACCSMCSLCNIGIPITRRVNRVWYHHLEEDGHEAQCDASQIRELMEADE